MRASVEDKFKRGILILLGLLVMSPAMVEAQSYATPERTAIAIGHYARARALLVEALAEFESGRAVARPDVLIDPDEWRLSVVSRTEELNRLLDPQPRVTRSGVQFKASKALIRRERDRLPPSDYAAQDSNTYGEEQREAELRAAKEVSTTTSSEVHAVGTTIKRETNDVTPPAGAGTSVSEATKSINPSSEVGTRAPEPKRTPLPAIVDEESGVDTASTANLPKAEEAPSVGNEASGSEEDAEISQAIEQAIKARLEKMSADGKSESGSAAAQVGGPAKPEGSSGQSEVENN